jgi:transposase
MTTLADHLVPDELWALAAPLLPPPPRPPYGGRHRAIPDRACFAAIVPWPAPPPRGGCCLHNSLAAARQRPAGAGSPSGPPLACSTTSPPGLGPARRARPGGLVAGERGHHERAGQAWGDHVGANPVDRGNPGSKLHLVCDGSGLPLTAAVTAANVNDTTMLEAVMDDVPPVWTRRGGGALGPPSSTPTRAMTAAPTGAICGGVGSGHGLPGVGWSPRPGLGGTGGRWSGRCRG